MARSTLLLALIFLTGKAFTQPINTARLDSLFDMLAEHKLAMGNVAISQNGVIQYQRAVGYAYIDSAKKIAANTDTKYRIGSASKMFTAVLIFQLIEEGKLRLNQQLAAFYPDLPNAHKITISNLLNHRSGLHNYTTDTNFPDWMDQPKSHAQLLKIITDKGADFSPGEKADYSNSNYLLLSYIIEKITKTTYEKAIKSRIISKIGLHNTYYGGPIDTSKNESASYKNGEHGWKKEKETNMAIHAGAGSIVSTATDMTKFMEALFGGMLVRPSSLDSMKALNDGYGSGLFPLNHGEHLAFGHNGRIEEFYSTTRYFPAEKLAVVYFTNGIIYPRSDIVTGILRSCFNENYQVPFSSEIILFGNALDKYLGRYTADGMPIVVNCTKINGKLNAETRGTNFELEPIARNYFMHAATGTFFEFFPESGELQIKETDNIYYLKR